MRRAVGSVLIILAAVLAVLICSLVVSAEEPTPSEAEQLEVTVTCQNKNTKKLTDGDEVTYVKLGEGSTVNVTAERGISSLYVLFDRIYGEWTLSDGSVTVTCGQNGFLHEYVDVASLFGYSPTSLDMSFDSGAPSLSEIFAFADGELPPWVQIWEPPCEEADLVLFSTHSDDEQLFFAGILPYYAGERKLSVEVVYFTTPFTYHDRQHEQLNGLWTVGVRNYPVSGEFIDAFSETAKKAYSDQERRGFSRDDMIAFQVEMIRRFRPHVIVGHDINGEYSHGQHIINCETLMEALPLAADASFDPLSAAEYGVWDTPKTYIHLWKENEIVMDWDKPLEAFGGKTAFEMTQEGFLCHKSQQWTWFRGWIFGKSHKITKASEIKTYSPCRYGLYRTNVGPDVTGGDMFENIPRSYAEIKAEEERLAEESRKESERVSAEESIAESERVSSEEESRRLEAENATSTAGETTARTDITPETPDADRRPGVIGIIIVIAAGVIATVLVVPQIKPKKQKRRKPH